MDDLEITQLLSQEEGLKLDFKREYELNHPDRKVRAAKWNEFIKDILALTNGNVGTASQTGHLVIGAGDILRPDGTRELFDVRKQGLKLSRQQIIEKVNACCHPPISDLFYSKVEVEGTWLAVIEIPPSPFVHETTRRLDAFKTTYSEGTVFIRRTEGIYPATQAERDALTREKQRLLEDHFAVKELAEAEAHYRRHLILQHCELDFQGLMQTARPLALPLKDIFVLLHAVGAAPEADTMSPERLELGDRIDAGGLPSDWQQQMEVEPGTLQQHSGRVTRRQTISGILARDAACVILGEPGAGKTTILRYVALAFAEGKAERRLRLKRQRLPILVPLASYEAALRSDDSMSLSVYLSWYYEQEHGLKDISSLFEYYLSRGEAIVLLDGLDEVVTQEVRTLIARRVKTFIDVATSPGNQVVVTSRVVGYREAPLPGHLPHYTVLRFNRAEIEQFAKRWCQAYEIWLANEDSEEVRHRGLAQSRQLVEAIHSHPGVKSLAANPLLLTILALIHRQEKKLPHRRVELYEVYARTLIERWGRARSLSGRTISGLTLDYHRIVKVVAPLALWMHRERASGTARRTEVVRQITLVLEKMGYEPEDADIEAERLLDDMRRYSGLLVERGRDAYGFMHLTFQEYFAARAIAMMRLAERLKVIRENLHDPRWREVILLTAGQIGSVDLREEEVSELVRGVLTADSWGNQYAHHDTLLAASCMADDVGLDVALTRDIIDALGKLLEGDIRLLAKVATSYLAQCPSGPLRRRAVAIATSVLQSQHPWSRQAAAELLGEIGQGDDEVINALLVCLDDEHKDVRQAVAETLGKIGGPSKQVADKLGEADDYWRRLEERVKELTGVGRGKDVNFDELPEDNLVKLLDYGSYRGGAMLALVRRKHLEVDTIQQIVARLTLSGKYERRAYHEALVGVPHCNLRVVGGLIAEATCSQWQIRQAAIRALGKLGHEHPEVLDILLDALANAKWPVKQAAGRAIGEFGVSSERTDTALLVAADHGRWEVRQAAIRSLGQVGTCVETVSERLVDALADETWLVRWTAFKVIQEYAKRCEGFADSLVKTVVEHHSVAARHSAVCLLGELKKATSQMVEVVLEATRDENEVVRQAAVAVLGELGQWTPVVQEVLRDALNDDSVDVRGNAASVLVAFGVKDTALETHLVASLTGSERRRVRKSSAWALGKVGSPSPLPLRSLLQYSEGQYGWEEDILGWQALYEIAQRNLTDFLDVLQRMELTKMQRRTSRGTVLDVLIRAGKVDSRAADTLLALSESQNWELRAFAAQALAYNSRDDEAVVSRLAALLHDSDARVRDAAVYALSRIAGSPYLEEVAGQPFVWEEEEKFPF